MFRICLKVPGIIDNLRLETMVDVLCELAALCCFLINCRHCQDKDTDIDF